MMSLLLPIITLSVSIIMLLLPLLPLLPIITCLRRGNLQMRTGRREPWQAVTVTVAVASVPVTVAAAAQALKF